MKRFFNIIVLIILVGNYSSFALESDNTTGVDTDIAEKENKGSGSIEADFAAEMMLFQDIPVVFSASRLGQGVEDVGVSVNVIDSNDIHYSGATSIIDALRYSPGVDILPGSRNRYRVTMGGLRFPYNDRNVTLINGRSANSPVAGGSDYLGIPVFMEDIERIEVVYGSGGAADWGSDAFTGVINVVTKRPEDIDPGFLYSTTINEFGDIYNHLRWVQVKDNWQWRLSTGYDEWSSSEDAVNNDDYASNDFARNYRFDSEFIVDLNELTELSFGAAYNHSKRGDRYQAGSTTIYNPVLPYSNGSQLYEYSRFFARIDRMKYDDFGFHLQWFGNYEVRKEILGFNNRAIENDLEIQLDYELGKHNLALGGNFRHYSIDILDNDNYSFDFRSNKYVDYQAGLFLLDLWNVNEFLDLEFQLREDYFSYTDTSDWSGRFSAIMNLAEEGRKKLKFSIGRTYRHSTYGWRDISFSTVSTNHNVENEHVKSLQLGYSFDCLENVRLEFDGYYHRYKDTVGASMVGFDPLLGPLIQVDNNSDVDVLGVQGKIKFNNEKYDIELWSSYEDTEVRAVPTDVMSILPPDFKIGINTRYYISDTWTLNTNYKYTDDIFSAGEVIVDDTSDLTIALSKEFADGNGEIMVGVKNLFDEDFNYNFLEDPDEVDESIGRTFFGRVQVKF